MKRYRIINGSPKGFSQNPPEFRAPKIEIPRSENANSALKILKLCTQK